MKLLFVEDDELLRKSYSIYLEELFDEIIEAADGKEGLEMYYKHKPDIIMLDISMPFINGMDVVKEIRKEDKDVTIIVLSAHSDKAYLFDAIELNIFKYLVKPLPRSLFKESILKAIENRKGINQENIVHLEDGFTWDNYNKILKKENKEVDLTKNEYTILGKFCNEDVHYFTLMDLFKSIYGENEEYSENKIMMILKRFRKKTSTKIIKNIYGMGYKFSILK
ncbi:MULTISPECIES: response regulator transcription factor [Malaciobacter]|jgi:DNA-binding response OmpR family regulator|uniref:DNA-binding response OmpR family regulator n=2 Tax=Malaciobacter TaxID=2321114 RepID=A0AB36ZYC6_9BACT|nr:MULTISPECIES: response regulator transcription factor [Malaciobacter]PHO09207.1 DNA-binding response regulator [Malaciobacter canalis]PPK62339.1 DNA-binding response OmpR family regulator [Malaciobacter marinus]QEE32226.1 two-component system response regulator [Malaciobacter canalis]SKB30858.1 DNA-binding response regulator, OmpR family, contains REC and winged-helix (wHTH) domain [Malaciobacter marinus]